VTPPPDIRTEATARHEREETIMTADQSRSAGALVRVDQVSKSYRQGNGSRGETALRGVSLTLREGRFVALMGPSGSGKSTLLNIIGGLDTPDEGRVFVRGVDTATLSDNALSDLRLRSIGFVFQFFNLLPNLSARRNVELPLLLLKSTVREAAGRAEEALARVGLGDKAARMPHELSGGEMQRVAIARAIVHRPALVLADEPTGNLDSATGQQILDLLRDLEQRDGMTILMATHDARGRDVCDEVHQIRDGQFVAA
jgi:putative ABC transport system ATP-binding protein